MGNNKFSAVTDRETTDAGGFFCEACLVSKSFDYKSPDARYCQRCYDSLSQAAESSISWVKPTWAPIHQNGQGRLL
jgi:uncharacterized paraquat-inducible protein A